MRGSSTPNHLAQETSPYLRQHAYNPVEWYPWGADALERARRENKPILLSIGYSACHWCHVMAHECFDDPGIAAVMNNLFINIKVDREERPDLDKIYQTAHQLLTRRGGGWPLTMFLTPDRHIPFFGGTYFPPAPRHGLPGFADLLNRVSEHYHAHAERIQADAPTFVDALRIADNPGGSGISELNPDPLNIARNQLEHSFDATFGGFGTAPKFPHPTYIQRLLRHWASTAGEDPDEHALEIAIQSLDAMHRGGIFDQIGGGFFRYAVDERWAIPHFEKMLYDNALLLPLFAQAYQITGLQSFAQAANDTATWVLREMQAIEGGYFSALDADSEGEEGKYYTWEPVELKHRLDANQYRLLARYYGLDQDANFEGKWHLFVASDVTKLAQETGSDENHIERHLAAARRILLKVREGRTAPNRDEKVLTAWNGLMIKGMAIAARILQRPDYAASATAAMDFIRTNLWRDGRLLSVFSEGKAHMGAYLDDYAFVLDALLELIQLRWREEDLEFAAQVADSMLAHFEDAECGGFYFTAADHEELIYRPKPLADDALPSGNGIAAYALARLGHLLGEEAYLTASQRVLRMAWPTLDRLPYAHTSLLLALEEFLYPPQVFLIIGDTPQASEWLRRCQASYMPRRLALSLPHAAAARVPGFAEKVEAADGRTTAYVCQNFSCSPPAYSLEDLDALLKGP